MTVTQSPTSTTRSDSSNTPSPAALRVTGLGLTAATVAWSVGMALIGDHEGFGWQSLVGGATALAFQVAIIRLLLLQMRTHAMGRGRVAKGVYSAQLLFMSCAMVSSVLDAFWLVHGSPMWMAFDLFWPLSMFTMVGIGVRIAIAGQWTGLVRWWTLWAQSWFVATIPLAMIMRDAGLIMASVQLVVGYGVLGVILAKKATVATR